MLCEETAEPGKREARQHIHIAKGNNGSYRCSAASACFVCHVFMGEVVGVKERSRKPVEPDREVERSQATTTLLVHRRMNMEIEFAIELLGRESV